MAGGGSGSGKSGDGSNKGNWLVTAIVGPIIVGVVIWLLTSSNSPFHHTKPPVTAGSIEAVTLDNGRPCCTFNVKVLIEGYDGQPCSSQAIIINADTGAQGTPGEETTYQPQAGEDEGAANDYVPITAPGNYTVRFILYAPNGTEMDQRDSIRFTVTAGQQ
jgi:hypothetical protein